MRSLKKNSYIKSGGNLQKLYLHLQVFNRRRVGEIERITIEDFNAREGITCSALYKSLGTNLQQVSIILFLSISKIYIDT